MTWRSAFRWRPRCLVYPSGRSGGWSMMANCGGLTLVCGRANSEQVRSATCSVRSADRLDTDRFIGNRAYMTPKRFESMADAIAYALELARSKGLSGRSMERLTGGRVKRQSIETFRSGDSVLSVKTADALAKVLGIVVTVDPRQIDRSIIAADKLKGRGK